MTTARPLLWDIYEEHLDEAAFLAGEWELALYGANYTVIEVAQGPEERLFAHLDGLVLGGKPVAERLLLPALADEERGKVLAAAWALLQAEDGDHLDAVVKAFPSAAPPARAAMARALELSPRRDLSARLAPLWEKSGDPALRGAILDALSPRDPEWARPRVAASLAASDPPLLSAALRAARRVPDAALAGYVERALDAKDREVREEAMATAFTLGVPALWEKCRREGRAAGDECRAPLGLLALSPGGHRDVLLARLGAADGKRHAAWALGFAGDRESIETLVAALDDDAIARAAADSLAAITGLALAGPFVRPAPPRDAAAEETDLDAPPPAVLPEDLLPLPNPAAIRKWWEGASARFAPGARYIGGRPRTPEALRAALTTATMWRRPHLSYELAAATRGPVALDPRSWARAQRIA